MCVTVHTRPLLTTKVDNKDGDRRGCGGAKGLFENTLWFLAFWIVAFQRYNHLKNLVRHMWDMEHFRWCHVFGFCMHAGVANIWNQWLCGLLLCAHYWSWTLHNRVLHGKGLVRTCIWPEFVFIFCTFCEKAASDLSQFGVCTPECSAVPQANNLVVLPCWFPRPLSQVYSPSPSYIITA